MKNIVLVGFMGTGKTEVAKRLAKRLNMKYINTDDIIEARENRTINEIFAREGEAYFRKVEKEIVREVSLVKGAVIATGGGVVLDNENVENLKKSGILVCLSATPEEILERTKSYTHRPLLNVPDPLSKIRGLLNTRDPYYKKADYHIDTSGRTIDEVTEEIVKLISHHLNIK